MDDVVKSALEVFEEKEEMKVYYEKR